jgi:hypothetical protein
LFFLANFGAITVIARVGGSPEAAEHIKKTFIAAATLKHHAGYISTLPTLTLPGFR